MHVAQYRAFVVAGGRTVIKIAAEIGGNIKDINHARVNGGSFRERVPAGNWGLDEPSRLIRG